MLGVEACSGTADVMGNFNVAGPIAACGHVDASAACSCCCSCCCCCCNSWVSCSLNENWLMGTGDGRFGVDSAVMLTPLDGLSSGMASDGIPG